MKWNKKTEKTEKNYFSFFSFTSALFLSFLLFISLDSINVLIESEISKGKFETTIDMNGGVVVLGLLR